MKEITTEEIEEIGKELNNNKVADMQGWKSMQDRIY